MADGSGQTVDHRFGLLVIMVVYVLPLVAVGMRMAVLVLRLQLVGVDMAVAMVMVIDLLFVFPGTEPLFRGMLLVYHVFPHCGTPGGGYYFTASFNASARSVCSQRTFRSSRPIWP